MMRGNGSAVLFVVGLVLAAFSIGQLASRPAVAGQYEPDDWSNRPRAKDLWQFSAHSDNLIETNRGFASLFTVTPDGQGRLPILTTIHSRGWEGGGRYHNSILLREINGRWYDWEIGDIQRPPGQEIGRFHESIGVVLHPGQYAVTINQGVGDLQYHLLLSGYWSKKP